MSGSDEVLAEMAEAVTAAEALYVPREGDVITFPGAPSWRNQNAEYTVTTVWGGGTSCALHRYEANGDDLVYPGMSVTEMREMGVTVVRRVQDAPDMRAADAEARDKAVREAVIDEAVDPLDFPRDIASLSWLLGKVFDKAFALGEQHIPEVTVPEGGEDPRALYPDWPIENALAKLAEMREFAERIAAANPEDPIRAAKRETMLTCLDYITSVVRGIREITPPLPVPARMREALVAEAELHSQVAGLREKADRIESAIAWGFPGRDRD